MTAGGTRGSAGIRALAIALVVAGALAAAAIAAAAEPSETTTFGADGIALASLGPDYVETGVASVTARADGGPVVQRRNVLETFLPDGAPDPAAPPTVSPKGRKVFPQVSGKTLVLEKKKLTRLNPDGSIDKSLGGDGTVASRSYRPELVVELGSGRIAEIETEIVGARRPEGVVEIVVLRPDGSRDLGAGLKETLLYSSIEVGLKETVPMAGGGALVVGQTFLLELRADGRVNRAFGEKGFVNAERLASASFRPDGSIAAVGRSYGPKTRQDLALWRFSSTGEPDSAFGPEGVRVFPLDGEQETNTASWAADGSVVAAGSDGTARPCEPDECKMEPMLAAFDAAGNLDPGFGEGGITRLDALVGAPEGLYQLGATALTRRPDGSIVAAGNAAPEATTAFLAAVSPAGQLIPSFGEGGIVRLRTPVPAGQELAGIAALPGGGLLAAGTTELDVEDTPVLIRYAPDGSLDPSFGDGSGYVVLGQSGRSTAGFAVRGEVALTSLDGAPQSQLLMSSTASGAPVSTFGSGGTVTLPKDLRVRALTFTDDGDPLVLAARREGPDEVLRYLPDGSLDKTFGRSGRAVLRLPGGGEVDASSLALDAGGSLVIAGSSEGRFALGSLRPNGRPNPHFGSHGWALVKSDYPAQYEMATPTSDGSHIYLAGDIGNESLDRIVLLRFDRRGHPDPTFGHHGRLSTPYSRDADPRLIAPRPSGITVVVDYGPRPILTFSPNGKVQREAPGPKLEFDRWFRGTTSGNDLFLAWSHPNKSLVETSYIAKRPLDP